MTGLTSVQIRFDQDFNGGSPAFGEIADVDVSIDGGVSWTNVLHQTVAVAGPNTQSIDVTALAAGQADVRARFHYYNAFAALWWQVDDVIVGQTSCVAARGRARRRERLRHQHRTGTERSAGDELARALHHALVRDSRRSRAARRPLRPVLRECRADDHGDADALLGRVEVRHRRSRMRRSASTSTLPPAGSRRRLGRSPSVSIRVGARFAPSRSTTEAGRRRASTSPSSYVPPASAGVRREAASPTRVSGSAGSGRWPAGNVVNAYPTSLDAPWGVAFDSDFGDLWISNSFLFAGDDREYRFLTDGTHTGETIDDSSWIADFAADGAYDPRTGEDLARQRRRRRLRLRGRPRVADRLDGNRICPAFGTSQRGLAYDPVTDTFYSGSWTDGVIHHFDASGVILDSAYVAIAVSGPRLQSRDRPPLRSGEPRRAPRLRRLRSSTRGTSSRSSGRSSSRAAARRCSRPTAVRGWRSIATATSGSWIRCPGRSMRSRRMTPERAAFATSPG